MNILEIVEKNTCLGQQLYTPIMGVCYIKEVTKWDEIVVSSSDDPCDKEATIIRFKSDGRFFKEGEPLLFPSEEMKDWKKLTWKKGDSLKSSINNQTVKFKDWDDDYYIEFRAYDENDNLNVYKTENFDKAVTVELLRPGQRVLVREAEDDAWKLHFFSHYQDGDTTLPICIGGDNFVWTIPYKGNQDLLGTTKSK